MRMKKKVAIGSGVFVLLLMIGGFAIVSADGPWRNACSAFHGRAVCGAGPGFHSSAMADFFTWRADQLAEKLGLTPEQQTKYDAWKGDVKTHFSQGRTARGQWMARLQTELDKEQPDVPMLLDGIKTRLDDMAAMADRNLDLFSELWQSLDRDQQQAVLDLVRERMQKHAV